MKITETPLTQQDKRLLRKVSWARIVLFFVMILPILVFSVYISYIALESFVEGQADMWSGIILLLVALFYLGASKFIFPYYRNLLKYRSAKTKLVVEVTVLRVSHRYTSGSGLRFYVETTHGSINTSRDVILNPEVPFQELKEGMQIYLHLIPDLKNEFLKVSAHPE